MTEYLYRDRKTDELFTLDGSMSDPPAMELEMEGRSLFRVLTDPELVNEQYDNGRQKYPDGSPIGSRGLGRGWPFAEHYDKKGRPLFANKRERDEAHARANHAGELLNSRDLSQPGRPELNRMFVDR